MRHGFQRDFQPYVYTLPYIHRNCSADDLHTLADIAEAVALCLLYVKTLAVVVYVEHKVAVEYYLTR